MSSSPGSVGLARAHPLTKTQAMEPSRQTLSSYGPPYPLGRWSLLLFLVYLSASSALFRLFACDALDDGKTYLRENYRIICTDTKHRDLQVYAAIMIFMYPVGIPLLHAVLLYRHREVLSAAKSSTLTEKPTAGRWEPYQPQYVYYEVVEYARRIVLTGVVVFIYQNDAAQIAIALLNALFFLVVSEGLSPFYLVSDMWVSRGGHFLFLACLTHCC